MIVLAPFVAAVLAVLVVIAAFTDLKARRIPNWLVASGLALGVGLNWFLYGGVGLKFAIQGLGLAMLIYLPLFVLRGMGAGDVKLMAAVGSLAGPGNWLRIFVLTAIIGGVVAVIYILSQGAAGKAARNLAGIVLSPFRGKAPYQDNPELDVTSGKGMSLPHGAVIALGTILFLFLMRM